MSYSFKESGTPIKESKKTKLEKTLIVVSVFLVAAVIGLLIGLIVVLTAPPPEVPPADDICYTETCIERSLWTMQAVDNTTDPCKDFFQYACGKWLANNDIPPGRSSIGTFNDIQEDLDKEMNATLALREVDPSKVNEHASDKAALLYQRCLKSDESPDSRINSALNLIVRNAGGCGLLTSDWSVENVKLINVMVAIQALTKDTFLSIKVIPDQRNASRYRITIGEPKLMLGLKDFYSERSPVYLKYKKEVREVFLSLQKSINPNLSENDFNIQIEEMLQFEQSLVNATSDNSTTASFDIKGNLSEFYRNYLDALVNSLVGKDVESSEELQLILGLGFLDKFEAVLNTANLRALANYGIWTLISNELYEGLPSSVRELKSKFLNSLTTERWVTCMAIDRRYFEWGVSRAYIDQHEDKFLKADVSNIVDTIAAEFKRTSLEQSDWIDEQTKKRAINKLNLMGNVVGYPDFIADDAKLNAYYAQIELPTDSTALFIDFLHKAARGASVNQMNNWVERDLDRSYEGPVPQTVNAFYHPLYNSIYIPAGILYPPSYGGDLPASMNYGGIGSIIGHEVGHGFDDQGRLYDENGKMENWWTDESIANFNARAQCLVDQYGKACYPDFPEPTCHNGTLTLGENIADNSGLRASYEAYVDWKKTHTDKKLPGLTHYTDEQMLFLNYAQLWCSKLTPERLSDLLVSDVHSQLPYRVNLNLMNVDQFSQVWKCNSDSAMNLPAEQECRVW